MADSRRTTVLPSADDMELRLLAACDDPVFMRGLYPLLCAHAGRSTDGVVLGRIILNGIRRMRTATGEDVNRARLAYPAFVEVLTDDDGVRDDALVFYEGVKYAIATF
jgi:hypothetical protein